ncbi:hypothetical protein PF005_g26223 [Phytophthora fragariae]|uniref:Uncharacterized protein n=1 Tax=Phytophthora fragariae TaxID=53985 RepID=A0A6A3ZJJ5_9STRA|nr:hypothetical protein PF009_g26947 [Phytophthora fragariae]KAE8973823.1 hypothetical protein PF011_g25104 [Phytophthora fragariae]KAE9066204.1 hypothetical protein PF007_g28563 [Phytophthora fragariae]KAE9069517.1 hypothetical protein PF010_g26635 [Phytophthora fragariae]KAE9083932.1 hypothetical protein PF006_g26580 [Phytophthora fragariae]
MAVSAAAALLSGSSQVDIILLLEVLNISTGACNDIGTMAASNLRSCRLANSPRSIN